MKDCLQNLFPTLLVFKTIPYPIFNHHLPEEWEMEDFRLVVIFIIGGYGLQVLPLKVIKQRMEDSTVNLELSPYQFGNQLNSLRNSRTGIMLQQLF